MDYWQIRKATESDKDAMLKIAHQYRDELGYVHPVGLMEHVAKGTVLVAERHGLILGFVDYHQPTRGDNKGFSVVYHLAVDKHQQAQGVGRNLLYAVPAPIRLKCTEDNDKANRFYKNAGMVLAGRDEGKSRPLLIWERRILFIQVCGDNAQYADVARQAGCAYGVRSDDPPKDYPLMFDIDWTKLAKGKIRWEDYVEMVKEYRPVMAMVPDYEFPWQYNSMWERAEQLRDLGVLRVLVCPKFEKATNHIPRWCVVAVSVFSGYAGYLPPMHQLAGRKVHLLGGSPKRQFELIPKIAGHGGQVISCDGNYHTLPRKSNQVYMDGTWVKLKPHEKVNYYNQLAGSGRNIARQTHAVGEWVQHPLFSRT